VVNSDRNEGKDYFEINRETGEIFTKVMFDREKQGAYALEVEARDGAPSARPNSNGQPNSGRKFSYRKFYLTACAHHTDRIVRIINFAKYTQITETMYMYLHFCEQLRAYQT